MKRIYVYRAIGLILFAAVLAFAGWAGVNKWHSDQEKASPGFVTQLTASNAQAKLTANGSKLMFVELCDSYTCNQMKDSLKSTANKYHDKINFYVVNVESDANVAAVFEQAAGQALQQAGSGMPQAFPMYIIMDAQGNVGNFNIGVLPADQLNTFVDQTLNPPAQTTTPSSSTSSSSTSSSSSASSQANSSSTTGSDSTASSSTKGSDSKSTSGSSK